MPVPETEHRAGIHLARTDGDSSPPLEEGVFSPDDDKEVFIQQLKEVFPDIYNDWQQKYPNSALKYADISPVGRTAYIYSLPNGCHVGNGYVKDGNYLINDKSRDCLFSGKFNSKEAISIRVKINKDMTVKITKNMITDEQTVYVD